jgi:molybdopterin/thiamine biosynthesis adenylyltransferase/rhodanese-related sulfurtransferase
MHLMETVCGQFPEASPNPPGSLSSRYARHLQLPEIGPAGQAKLAGSRVLVVGAGGLGSPVLLYLAAAGVGDLVVVDDDQVAIENLQRQVLHSSERVGQPKVESARQRLADLNPEIHVEIHPVRFVADNSDPLIESCDLVVNAADNFPTRYLVNDRCVALGKPHVHGAVHRFQGEVAVFAPGGPCYRCLHPVPPAPGTVSSCDEAGVLGVLPGVVGCLQAAETIKWLVGTGDPLAGRLLLLDLLAMRFQTVALPRDPGCAACGTKPKNSAQSAHAGSGESEMVEITPTQLKEKQDRGDKFLLIDVREPHELAIAAIAGAIPVPLGTLPARADEFDPDAEIVLMCRSGRRSADALLFLQSRGFTNLANLKGGILAYADDVDRSLTKY